MSDEIKSVHNDVIENYRCVTCETKEPFTYLDNLTSSILSGLSLAILMYLGIIIANTLLDYATNFNISYESVLNENIGNVSFLAATFVLVVGLSLAFISDAISRKFHTQKIFLKCHIHLLKSCDLLSSYLLCMSIFILISWSNVNVIFFTWLILLILISPTFAWVREKNKKSVLDLFGYGMISILYFIGIVAFTYFHENFCCEGLFFCGLF